jgi:hypothetical protein
MLRMLAVILIIGVCSSAGLGRASAGPNDTCCGTGGGGSGGGGTGGGGSGGGGSGN